MEELEELGAQVLAIATDDPESLRTFAAGNELGYPLLHDPGGEVIERYGIRNREHQDGVLPDPTVLVLDREGTVREKWIDPDYTTRPPAEDVLKAVQRVEQEDRAAGSGEG